MGIAAVRDFSQAGAHHSAGIGAQCLHGCFHFRDAVLVCHLLQAAFADAVCGKLCFQVAASFCWCAHVRKNELPQIGV